MTLLAKIKKLFTKRDKKSSKVVKKSPRQAVKHEDYELEERRQIYNPYREF